MYKLVCRMVSCVATIIGLAIILGIIVRKMAHCRDRNMRHRARKALGLFENMLDDVNFMFKR